MTNEITYENALAAAEKVRKYINENQWCYGCNFADETFELSYILQEWSYSHPEDFKEEYEWIHRAATHNWHMYEDPEY